MAVKATQTMKLTLWIGSTESREEGPAKSSQMPLAITATVESTTIGAIRRSGVGGGPFST